MFQSSASQAGFSRRAPTRKNPVPVTRGLKNTEIRIFENWFMEILRLPAYDWLTFGTVDIYMTLTLWACVSLRDKGEWAKFRHEKSGFDDDGIYEFD